MPFSPSCPPVYSAKMIDSFCMTTEPDSMASAK